MIERYVATGSFTGRIPAKDPPISQAPKLTTAGTDVVHLHWLWKRGPAALRGVSSAVALCGARFVPRDFVSSHLDDATCPMCKRLAS
jgi:hypothetical protein